MVVRGFGSGSVFVTTLANSSASGEPSPVSPVWFLGSFLAFHLAHWCIPFSVISYVWISLTLTKIGTENEPLFCQLRRYSPMFHWWSARLIIGWNHTALESLVVALPKGTDVEVYSCNQLFCRILALLPRCAGDNVKACLHDLLLSCVNCWLICKRCLGNGLEMRRPRFICTGHKQKRNFSQKRFDKNKSTWNRFSKHKLLRGRRSGWWKVLLIL